MVEDLWSGIIAIRIAKYAGKETNERSNYSLVNYGSNYVSVSRNTLFKMKFILPLPPTLNATYKTRLGQHGLYKSAEAKAWQQEVEWKVKQKKPLLGSIAVEINMYLNRDRDIDSSLKLVLDTMADCGVYKNDSQVEILTVIKYKGKEYKPYLGIEVHEMREITRT